MRSNMTGDTVNRTLLVLTMCALLVSGCATVDSAQDRNPELHAIGIYEGPVHRPRTPSQSPVHVKIFAKSGPVVLALFSYESVMWNISTAEGVKIREIILSSADHSNVSGLAGISEGSVKITRRNIGSAYDDRTMKAVTPKLKEMTGLDPRSFQTLYRGFEFTVH